VRALRRLPPFALGCLFELALLGAAALGATCLGRPWWSLFRGTTGDVLAGGLATLPALGCFFLLCSLPWRPLVRIRRLLETVVPQWFSGCSWREVALISAIAGVAEEALFRGLLQGWLADSVGPAAALVLASVAFGLCHALTPSYAVIATFMGAYLGALWLVTGNLAQISILGNWGAPGGRKGFIFRGLPRKGLHYIGPEATPGSAPH
jgi:membrane protease YdiL (CAAX protease family)